MDLSEINKKIRESKNPYVEYLIQSLTLEIKQNIIAAGGGQAPAQKAPVKEEPKKKEPEPDEDIDAPMPNIFDDDDDW